MVARSTPASLSNPSRPFTPAAMTKARRLSRKITFSKQGTTGVNGEFEFELRRTAENLSELSTDSSRIELLKPWMGLKKSPARSEVAAALREGLLRSRDARSRLVIAREALKFADDDAALELVATQTIFEASQEEETGEEEGLVPILVARLTRAAQSRASPDDLEPLLYITATLENYLGGRRRLEIVKSSQGLLTCALCDLLRAATTWRQKELMFHATGALRNVCGDHTQTRQLESGKAVNVVARALHVALEKKNDLIDWDLLLNIARCLARLSRHNSKWAWLVAGDVLDDPESLLCDVFDALIAAYSERRRDVAVRLAYALGNATADNPPSREIVGRRINRILEMLDDVRRRAEDEDILTNLIRIVANCSVDPRVGARVALSPQVASCLSHLLVTADDNEELLLNVVSALANLSYYDTSMKIDKETCSRLVDVLLHPNREAVSEAARAFGNLSRDSHARRLMSAVEADEALVVLLEHADRDVVFAAVGALVNLVADSTSHKALNDATPRLVDIVRSAGIQDLPLASVACKALHNWLRSAEKYAYDDASHMARLRRTLEELIDVTADAVDRRDEEREFECATFLEAANGLLRLLKN